ncbi:uncharacterized protein LOC135673429 isoform X3 [Musa acuminata AAA Group]|uniref:uncharacterized protein LOC135673429 isoform X3 n=1 Tax=Musa acuminata AAA Group TaxID=214697 RepID=UPI0031D59ACE
MEAGMEQRQGVLPHAWRHGERQRNERWWFSEPCVGVRPRRPHPLVRQPRRGLARERPRWMLRLAVLGRRRRLPRRRTPGKLRLSQREPSPHRASASGRASGEEKPTPAWRRRGRPLESLPSASFCRLQARGEDEPYQARAIGDLPQGEPSAPLRARWEGFTRGSRVWADGDSMAGFVRGGLHPDIARDLYTLSSEVLLGRSAKSLLWGTHYAAALMDRIHDAGWVIDILSGHNADLRKHMEEVRAGATPEAVAIAEQRASDLDAEATHLHSELKVSVE